MDEFEMDFLMHEGRAHDENPPGRGSGRYGYGTGDNPYQHGYSDLRQRVDDLRKQGFNYFYDEKTGKSYTGDTAIARSLGMTSGEMRSRLSILTEQDNQYNARLARQLRDEGKSLSEIAELMGYPNDSSVRHLLKMDPDKKSSAQVAADILKKTVDDKGMIDISAGTELELGISKEKLTNAVNILKEEGYVDYGIRQPQVTNPGKYTTIQVLCPPGTEYKDVYDNMENIQSVGNYFVSHDGGESFDPAYVYPKSMDSSRLMVRYRDDGGLEKDGVIELRRGVDDLDLGGSHYSQVRILVDGTHYLKGMAVYGDDMPDGVDVIFNTNKTPSTPVMGPKGNTILKPIGKDPTNPFGSLIKEGIRDPDDPDYDDKKGGQSYYYDKNGQKQLSLINKRSDEGDWEGWADKVPSQFLSKQPVSLIKKQLNLSVAEKQEEYDRIMALDNPVVKKHLLNKFADERDTDAVNLKAAALPGQKYHVILPLNEAKDTEIYAPRYKNGQTVALIRYPHAGRFEIPILKVNNNMAEGKRVITPDAPDAVGISKNVADRLSGADFDGDTVMLIPCNDSYSKVHIESQHPLTELEGFDPKEEYGGKPEGTFVHMTSDGTQKEMGIISNLITDMTLRGATEDELARAVKHSMVVIDAEKHGLDYKLSEKVNGIQELKDKYQGHIDEDGVYRHGAATLISRAKSPVRIDKRVGNGYIDRETGQKKYNQVHEEYVDKNGKVQVRTQEISRMENTDDAFTLVSDYQTKQELAYADYANKMKSMANTARLEYLATDNFRINPAAKKEYATEVQHLQDQLALAKMNAPRERMAQRIAGSQIKAIKSDNPDIPKKELKKLNQQKLTQARIQVGAQRRPVTISDREWEAIQAHAISSNLLGEILQYTDIDRVRELATPHTSRQLSQGTINRIVSMRAAGYTLNDISEAVGVSVATVRKQLS